MSKVNSRWCIKHEDGWCAVKGGRRPVEGENNVATRCKHFVILPGGIEYREPTCSECLADIVNRSPESRQESKRLSFLADLDELMDKHGLAIVPTYSGGGLREVSFHDPMMIIEIDSQTRDFVLDETIFREDG